MTYKDKLKCMNNKELVDEIGHLLWDAEKYREVGAIETEILNRLKHPTDKMNCGNCMWYANEYTCGCANVDSILYIANINSTCCCLHHEPKPKDK